MTHGRPFAVYERQERRRRLLRNVWEGLVFVAFCFELLLVLWAVGGAPVPS